MPYLIRCYLYNETSPSLSPTSSSSVLTCEERLVLIITSWDNLIDKHLRMILVLIKTNVNYDSSCLRLILIKYFVGHFLPGYFWRCFPVCISVGLSSSRPGRSVLLSRATLILLLFIASFICAFLHIIAVVGHWDLIQYKDIQVGILWKETINGSVQDGRISSASAVEIQQSCTEPSRCNQRLSSGWP